MFRSLKKILTGYLAKQSLPTHVSPDEYADFFESRLWRVMQHQVLTAIDIDMGALMSAADQRQKDMAAGRLSAFEDVLNMEMTLRTSIVSDGELLSKADDADQILKQILALIQQGEDDVSRT